jgi:hypothetical protein
MAALADAADDDPPPAPEQKFDRAQKIAVEPVGERGDGLRLDRKHFARQIERGRTGPRAAVGLPGMGFGVVTH